MRVLVCGTRHEVSSTAAMFIRFELGKLPREGLVIIEGGAPGVDSVARAWANAHGVEVSTHHANWDKYGRSAGPIRNARMLSHDKPDLVLAFHTDPGLGRGTRNMVSLARADGVETRVFILEASP